MQSVLVLLKKILGTLEKLLVLLRAAAASTMNIVDRNRDINIIDATVKNKWRWDWLAETCKFIFVCRYEVLTQQVY